MFPKRSRPATDTAAALPAVSDDGATTLRVASPAGMISNDAVAWISPTAAVTRWMPT